jgi:type VI secretion system secreted protein Hcp
MASSAYLTLKGQKQGDIQGGVTEKGRENSILVHGFNMEILSPRDPQSGLPTGKRQHDPVYIMKEIDRASPKLWSALVNNENLTVWQLNFYAPAPTGIEKLIYRIELTNASIASIRESMADNEFPANVPLPLREQLSFVYQKITWTWMDPATTASDDWETPIGS